MSAFRPTPRLAAATMPTPHGMSGMSLRGAPNKVIPILVVGGAVYGVVSYIVGQLHNESAIMDRRFAQQNTPAVEQSQRRALLIDTEGDPRRTPYNILNWK
ncbi:hypothetical protein QBC35DRAFT_509847 [Podospora australis]|uniref:Uncharacterized protein n=1 Tax=Podospora australis TaxID=1536484 RepID=A0AAN6WIL5_9PEZI|nr:hypothetical protein QBC35DRAFT_509847 [Podospora australis]